MNVKIAFSIVVWIFLSSGAFWRLGGNHVGLLLFVPLVLVIFPMWFSHLDRPFWARKMILLLALFYFSIPFWVAPLELSLGLNFQARGLMLVGLFWGVPTDSLLPLCIDMIVYLFLLAVLGYLYFKISMCNDREFFRIKLKGSFLFYLLWCLGMPMLLGFDYQIQIIYWMSVVYYMSSRVSKSPVGDLIFSCCCSLVFPFVCASSWGESTWEWDAFKGLFGFLFENSAFRIPGILILTAYPALFFLMKFWQVGKTQHKALENNV